MNFLEKVNTALQNLENHKVLLKDPVRRNEGPWLGMDLDGASSFVPRVPWLDFWCLKCKNMVNITNFHLWAIPSLAWLSILKRPAWLRLSTLAPSYPYLPALTHSYPLLPTLTHSYPLLPALTHSTFFEPNWSFLTCSDELLFSFLLIIYLT